MSSGIAVNTVFRIKNKDNTLFLEREAHSDGRVLCVVFQPENVISNVPDNRFDARIYKSIEKYGIEYVTKSEFDEQWKERASQWSTYKDLPSWVKFEDRES